MGEPAKLSLKVRHYEVDLYGHVNHANYIHYLETARIEALEAVGLSLGEMRRQGYPIVAVGLSVKYHAPVHPGETLDIVTFIREIRGARSVWVQEIREATSQRLVVTAQVTGAFMTDRGRPVRAPASFREKLAALHVQIVEPAAEVTDDDSMPNQTDRAVSWPRTADQHEPRRSSHSPRPRPRCICRGPGLRETLKKIAGLANLT